MGVEHEVVRGLVAQQLVEDHAQRVDVGRGRHHFAAQLLRAGVAQRQRLATLLRQRLVRVVGEQLGDAEVEQLGLTVRRHQDVRGLEVAVHHELAMRVGHRVADHQEEPQAFGQIDLARVGEQRLAYNQLHHKVGRAAFGAAVIQEPGDVWVHEAGEDASFAAKAPGRVGRRRCVG